MAASALEEKINKIKLQNEEIKRRYEEVEADKKNAAKLNALVQMVPSSDWPERKEPSEFANPSKAPAVATAIPALQVKARTKEHFYSTEGKSHKFSQGDGPPPDPKYNFLADSERDFYDGENTRDEEKKKERTKFSRGGPKKRADGRDSSAKEHYAPQMAPKKDALPEYDAWRAERNRIDEARISRQKTAEGNWRREWDNNKIAVDDDATRKDSRYRPNENVRWETKDQRYHFNGEQSNYGRTNDTRQSANSPFKNARGPQANNPRMNNFQHQLYPKPHYETFVASTDDRTVSTASKGLKITLNHGTNLPKGPVMSVKVNSPSIAGTGRVGPRQKTRVAYSSHSENETTVCELENTNGHMPLQAKSPYSQRKKDAGKTPHSSRGETWKSEKVQQKKDAATWQKQFEHFNSAPKSPQAQGRSEKARGHEYFSFQETAKSHAIEESEVENPSLWTGKIDHESKQNVASNLSYLAFLEEQHSDQSYLAFLEEQHGNQENERLKKTTTEEKEYQANVITEISHSTTEGYSAIRPMATNKENEIVEIQSSAVITAKDDYRSGSQSCATIEEKDSIEPNVTDEKNESTEMQTSVTIQAKKEEESAENKAHIALDETNESSAFDEKNVSPANLTADLESITKDIEKLTNEKCDETEVGLHETAEKNVPTKQLISQVNESCESIRMNVEQAPKLVESTEIKTEENRN